MFVHIWLELRGVKNNRRLMYVLGGISDLRR